ncbi:hypothetical protein J6590_039748 [Homalodisca vitripennis]|nr:hypothetical protein J6590_039748 [Homalodisca vitripennis]
MRRKNLTFRDKVLQIMQPTWKYTRPRQQLNYQNYFAMYLFELHVLDLCLSVHLGQTGNKSDSPYSDKLRNSCRDMFVLQSGKYQDPIDAMTRQNYTNTGRLRKPNGREVRCGSWCNLLNPERRRADLHSCAALHIAHCSVVSVIDTDASGDSGEGLFAVLLGPTVAPCSPTERRPIAQQQRGRQTSLVLDHNFSAPYVVPPHGLTCESSRRRWLLKRDHGNTTFKTTIESGVKMPRGVSRKNVRVQSTPPPSFIFNEYSIELDLTLGDATTGEAPRHDSTSEIACGVKHCPWSTTVFGLSVIMSTVKGVEMWLQFLRNDFIFYSLTFRRQIVIHEKLQL